MERECSCNFPQFYVFFFFFFFPQIVITGFLCPDLSHCITQLHSWPGKVTDRYVPPSWGTLFRNESAQYNHLNCTALRPARLCVTVFACADTQPGHYKNRIVSHQTRAKEKKKTVCSTHTHTQPSISTASIHRIHPLNTPYFLPSFPLFHFPTSNCSAGFSSFKFIAFHAFHLLSE